MAEKGERSQRPPEPCLVTSPFKLPIMVFAPCSESLRPPTLYQRGTARTPCRLEYERSTLPWTSICFTPSLHTTSIGDPASIYLPFCRAGSVSSRPPAGAPIAQRH